MSAQDLKPSMFKPAKFVPNISPRISSLLGPAHAQNLSHAHKSDKDLERKASQLNTGSSLSQASGYLDIQTQRLTNWEKALKSSHDALKKALLGRENDGEMQDAIRDCLEKRAKLAAEDVTIRRHRIRIIEEMAKVKDAEKEDIPWAKAYATIITREFKGRVDALGRQRRDTGQRKAWDAELSRRYNVYDPNGSGDVWCPVIKAYEPPTWARCAHIVPWGLGFENIGFLFGEDSGREVVARYENGMVLSKIVEKALELFWISLIPSHIDKEGLQAWRVTLIDESKRDVKIGYAGKRWGEIDGDELHFQSNFRPGKRYLYLQFVSAVLVTIRFRTKGWVEKKEQLMTGKIWATPGKYINRPILAKLGEYLGDVRLSQECLDAGTFGSEEIGEDEIDLVAKDLMAHAAQPELLVEDEMVVDKEEEEEWQGFPD